MQVIVNHNTAYIPTALLVWLESVGIRLSIRGGRLHAGPQKLITEEIDAMIRDNRAGLIGAITHQCPVADCNAPLRTHQDEDYLWLACPNDRTHYCTLLRPCIEHRVSTEGMRERYGYPCQVENCGWPGATYDGYCLTCLEVMQAL